MSNLTEEQMKELEEFKAEAKDKNVEAIAQILLDVRQKTEKVLNDNVDLRRMISQNNQEIATLRGEINALKAMGFRGNMGTGSTVHAAGE